MRSDFDDYDNNLLKFIEYIENCELIYQFILSNGECSQDVEKEVKEVSSSYGRMIFDIGHSNEEEIRNIYAIASYIAHNHLLIQAGYAWGYGHSNKYPDMVKGFNDRFIMILISHIEDYLKNISIDMGLDDTIIYNISIENGQIIVAEEGSSVAFTNNVNSIDEEKLASLIEKIQKECVTLEIVELANINDHLKELKEELLKPQPNKTLIQNTLSFLSGIKDTTEFAAAVTALIQFVQPFISID